MRKQRVVLEHGADVALVRLQMLDAGAIQADFARGRLFEAGDHAQRSGLAAARRAEQRKELAASDVERNRIDRAVRRIVLRDVASSRTDSIFQLKYYSTMSVDA